MNMKNLLSYLNGAKQKKAFTKKLKNGKTQFQKKAYDAFVAEKLALAKALSQ